MKNNLRKLALATALTASAGAVFAQLQPNGRDSVYADPTRPTRQAGVTAPSIAEVRPGRDSVYASASATSSSSVTADVTLPHRYGRSSVYAIELEPATDTSATRIGRAPSDRTTH